MSVVLPTIVCFVAYFLAFRFYARFLGSRLYGLRPDVETPAHALRDDCDYVPTSKPVVFGHHFASITGLAPMLGPAVAVIWGWLPSMLWVVFGAIFIGCVHDMSALVLSIRAQGKSIGKVGEDIIGPRAKTLFLFLIFFAIALAMGVFVFVIGNLFSTTIDGTHPGFPSAVTPSAGIMVLALALGVLTHRHGFRLAPLAVVAFVLSLGLVYLGFVFPTLGLPSETWPTRSSWIVIQLVYALAAAVLPVWVLLQARDFVNSLMLYLGLIAAYAGMFLSAPLFQAPALRVDVPGSPGLFPFVFIVVACGAASGFHGLVSSGTTAKQLNKETDATTVGYGGMIAESLLGLLAVLATTAGMTDSSVWAERYRDWGSAQGLAGNIGAFIDGTGRFISALGVPQELAAAFVAVVVVSFALTTLDSATRLLRYNIEEIGEMISLKILLNRYVSSTVAVVVIAWFAFYEFNGKPAALALWTLFGTTNQLLAGLTLLTATAYLKQRNKPVWFTGLPAALILVTTLFAMIKNLSRFLDTGQYALLAVGGALLVLGAAIAFEGVRALLVRRESNSL